MKRMYSVFLLLVPSLYALSFFLPATNEDRPIPGYLAFAATLAACFDPNRDAGHLRFPGVAILAWWANPALWIAYVFLLRRALARVSVAAAVAGLAALPVLFLDAGKLGAGYWVWLASMVLLLSGGLLFWWNDHKQ